MGTDRVIVALTPAQHRELKRLTSEFIGNMLIEQRADESIDVSFTGSDGSLVAVNIAADGRLRVDS